MAKNTNVSTEPLIKVIELKKYFPLKKTKLFQKEVYSVKANDGITLTIHKGETLGLVGESGCGKSTLGRVLLQLYPLTSGKVLYYGYQLAEFAPKYYLDDIKKLSELKKEHDQLLKNIDDVKVTIAKVQNDANINAKKDDYKAKIAVIEEKNKNIYDECIEKCGTFITLNDLKTVNTFRKFDAKIASMSKKLEKLNAELKSLEDKKNYYDNNLDQNIVNKIEQLKSKLKQVEQLSEKISSFYVGKNAYRNILKFELFKNKAFRKKFITGSENFPSLDIESYAYNRYKVDYKSLKDNVVDEKELKEKINAEW